MSFHGQKVLLLSGGGGVWLAWPWRQSDRRAGGTDERHRDTDTCTPHARVRMGNDPEPRSAHLTKAGRCEGASGTNSCLSSAAPIWMRRHEKRTSKVPPRMPFHS